jgi:hypothetical protein
VDVQANLRLYFFFGIMTLAGEYPDTARVVSTIEAGLGPARPARPHG